MENRSLSVAAYLILVSLLGGSAWAAGEPSAEQLADWQLRLEKAGALRNAAGELQATANTLFKEKEAACFNKFRINACLDEARLVHSKQTTEARRLENESKALERLLKKEQLADKDARRALEAEQRAASLPARAAETRAALNSAEENEAAQRADKERRAQEGQRERAAEIVRHQKKVAEHAARVARQKAKSEHSATP
jgi:colicin import membrane protein